MAELEKNEEIRVSTVGFSGLGLDEKLAEDAANQFESKDRVKFFATMKKFLENYKKSIEKELMDKTPGVSGNGGQSQSEDDLAIKKAKELFGNNAGVGKNYADVMNHYFKK